MNLSRLKITRLKFVAVAVALVLAGVTTYAIVHTLSPALSLDTPLSLDAPINIDLFVTVPGPKDAVRNVLLTGKIRYADGRPAGGVEIDAQIQSQAMLARDQAARQRRHKGVVISTSGARVGTQSVLLNTQQEKEVSWNKTVSMPDGTYTLPVGAGIPYNVMVYDRTGKWVAAAIENASGAQNSTVNLRDLVLTRGAIVTGTVTDATGRPLPGVFIVSYGPSRPETSVAVSRTTTGLSGQYRQRVAPGVNCIYVDIAGSAGVLSFKDADKTVNVAAGEIKTVDLTL